MFLITRTSWWTARRLFKPFLLFDSFTMFFFLSNSNFTLSLDKNHLLSHTEHFFFNFKSVMGPSGGLTKSHSVSHTAISDQANGLCNCSSKRKWSLLAQEITLWTLLIKWLWLFLALNNTTLSNTFHQGLVVSDIEVSFGLAYLFSWLTIFFSPCTVKHPTARPSRCSRDLVLRSESILWLTEPHTNAFCGSPGPD